MSDEAAYLVDMVLPEARYRQWTLTFPWTMRYLMAKDYKLITAILNVAMRILFAYQRRVARKAGHSGAKTAAVVFVQRFGSQDGRYGPSVHEQDLLCPGHYLAIHVPSHSWCKNGQLRENGGGGRSPRPGSAVPGARVLPQRSTCVEREAGSKAEEEG